MSLPRTVAEVINEHVTLELECIDRMYLNVYVPQLQRELGVVSFFRFHRGDQFALTQVLDRPVSGRVFFEEVIRENLDLGRPDKVQLIFNRRVTRRTPSRFRTRVLTAGVTPTLHVDYKRSRIKQYHKEGRALRTETTLNNTRDFDIGRRLHNLPQLRTVGFQANRRLLDVERISHDPTVGEDAFRRVTQPTEVDGQRASALRYGDPTVLALFGALLCFHLLPRGFSNRDLREHFAPVWLTSPPVLNSKTVPYVALFIKSNPASINGSPAKTSQPKPKLDSFATTSESQVP